MRHTKLDSLGVSAFCESMAMMVQAGIQTFEAVSLLRQDERRGGELEQALAHMQPQMEQGMRLSDAMASAGAFPDYAVKMIAAGEDAGRLEDVLFRLASYYAEQKTVTEKLKSSVTYPAVMLLLIVAVLAVLLTMVLPAFTGVYNSMTGSLAASSYGYIRWAYGFCWVALVLMLALAAALLIGLLLWNGKRRAAVERALHKIPVCAGILDTMGLFRFTSALATFLSCGTPQDLAVMQSAEMTQCPPIEKKLEGCVSRMEQGHGIAQAAYDEQLFEPVYGRMLLAGDRSGNMDAVLQRLIKLLEEHCTEQVDRLVGVIDPLLSGVLMVTVGLSLISVMLPLIGMMSSIG